jgi:queuosine precursor transporter
MIFVVLYLGAVVLANLTITHFGIEFAILVAFLFIGLDLTSRDHLHDAWRGEGLIWKMALLIAAGSILSWLFNRDAAPVAIASFTAFASAATVDAVVYHLLQRYPRWLRINGSNIPSAAVDSLVFLSLVTMLTSDTISPPIISRQLQAQNYAILLTVIAALPWGIIFGQFLAKTAGGFVWSLILRHIDRRPAMVAE